MPTKCPFSWGRRREGWDAYLAEFHLNSAPFLQGGLPCFRGSSCYRFTRDLISQKKRHWLNLSRNSQGSVFINVYFLGALNCFAQLNIQLTIQSTYIVHMYYKKNLCGRRSTFSEVEIRPCPSKDQAWGGGLNSISNSPRLPSFLYLEKIEYDAIHKDQNDRICGGGDLFSRKLK